MLTPQSALIEIGYLLLVVAVLMARPERFRLFVSLAALAWAVQAFRTGDLTALAGAGAVLLAAVALIARRLWEDARIAFSPDEREMLGRLFTELPKSRARHLIDQGLWLAGKAGDVLTREGEPVDHLYYLAEGEARVIAMGSEVGLCRAGDLIGELTVLSGETASATVILNTAARFWCAPADDLRPYVEAHEDVRRAIEHGFATVLKSKLRASNRAIAAAQR